MCARPFQQEMTIRNEVLKLKPSPANAIVQQQCATVTVMNTIVVPPSSYVDGSHGSCEHTREWQLAT